MSRKSRTTLAAVERLVEQRRLFQDWLAKLDLADGMPGHVVERVRNDYRARLEQVVAELAEHGDALRQALEDAQLKYDSLLEQQARRKDEQSELRLRRQVGELADDEFKRRHAESKQTIDQLSKELQAALRDIERFEEILEAIQRPAAAQPESPAPPAGESGKPRTPIPAASEKASETVREPPVTPAAPAAPAASTQPQPPAPAPRAQVAEPAPELDVAAGFLTLEPSAEPAATPAPKAGRSSSEGAKTLVCKACGAKNLPTEWYCEKCGAELTAI